MDTIYLRLFSRCSRILIDSLRAALQRESIHPGIVNRTQSNYISIKLNRTQSNSIDGLSLIEFGNRTKSNSHKKNWPIERNRTFDFRTLDFCKTGVKNQ